MATTAPEMAPDARPERDHSILSHVPPGISADQAASVAEQVFGVSGELRMLSSERDSNFHIRLADGVQALLKFTNAKEERGVTGMQTAALMNLAVVAPDLPVQRICQTRSGKAWDVIVGPSGQEHVVRLLSWLDGTMLHAPQRRLDQRDRSRRKHPQDTPAARSEIDRGQTAFRGDSRRTGHRLTPMVDGSEHGNGRCWSCRCRRKVTK